MSAGGTCAFLLAVAATLVACSEPVGPSVPEDPRPDVAEWVTGDAAAALDDQGHFRVSSLRRYVPAAGTRPERAEELAQAWARILGRSVGGCGPVFVTIRCLVEREYGAIDYASLVVKPGTAVFADSPYEPLPDTFPADRLGFLRRSTGPYYHVPVFLEGRQVMMIAVSLWTEQVWVDAHGFPRNGDVRKGGEWSPVILPAERSFETYPLSPEETVAFVGRATGARVVEVPRRLLWSSYFSEGIAHWELRLDRPVEVEVDGVTRSTDRVFVWGLDSRGLRISVAAEEQPTVDPRYGEHGLRVKPGFPIHYHGAAWPGTGAAGSGWASPMPSQRIQPLMEHPPTPSWR